MAKPELGSRIRWTDSDKPDRALFTAARSAFEPINLYFTASTYLPAADYYEEDWRVEWLKDNVTTAIAQFWEVVAVSPDVRGGVPVLRGTRMPLSRVFAELADGFSIVEIAADFELDPSQLETLLGSLSMFLDQPFSPPNARISAR